MPSSPFRPPRDEDLNQTSLAEDTVDSNVIPSQGDDLLHEDAAMFLDDEDFVVNRERVSSENTVFETLPDEENFPILDSSHEPLDYAELERKRRRKNTILKALAAAAALSLIAGLLFLGFRNTQKDEEPVKVAPSSAPIVKSPEYNPILEQFPDAPEVRSAQTTVSSKGTVFAASSGEKLVLPKGTKITPASQKCRVIGPAEFCLAGRATVSKTPFDVYFLKDAAHSRLFENPNAYRGATVQGSPAAGLISLETGSAKRSTLVVVTPKSSGWMLVAADDTTDMGVISSKIALN